MPRIALNYEEIGERIRNARKAKKMSMATLSEITGYGFRSISLYERGIIKPPMEFMLNCCIALDIKLDKLITIYYEGD